ncbi:MAG: fused MFS/spermidine synthase [bacterium]
MKSKHSTLSDGSEKQFTSKEATKQQSAAKLKALLVITPLITGAAVMMIELLGTRIISPYFGVSLYVWTSLITVTLLALAGGYWWGGYIADRKRTASFLYFLIFLAGAFLLFVPVLKKTFLVLSSHLGLRFGSLAGSFLLFFLPLFLLGAVTPYLVKLYARDMRTIGKVVGNLYAISTAGSFAGTILSGFVFIPHFKNESILFFISAALIVLCLVYWLFFLDKGHSCIWLFVTALVLLPVLFIQKPFSKQEIDSVFKGASFHLVTEKNSAYGQIKVFDVNNRIRVLILDGLTQNAVDQMSGLSVHEYTYALPLIARSYNPEGKTALAIGLGAGTIPSELRRNHFTVDCVEINPVMVTVAQNYFGFNPDDVNLSKQDARFFVRNCRKKYDMIFLDAFNGDSVPEHLLTLEMFRDLKRLMNPDGVLCINFFGSLARKHSFGTRSLAKTLKQVFAQVVAFTNLPPEEIGGNIYFLATENERDPGGFIQIDRTRCYYSVYGDLCKLWNHKIDVNKDADRGIVLTDAYNPILFYDASTREMVREKMQALLGGILL